MKLRSLPANPNFLSAGAEGSVSGGDTARQIDRDA